VVDAAGRTRASGDADRDDPPGQAQAALYAGMDCGDFVIVVNADKVRVTGHKLDQKFYYRYSGYPGGLAQVSLRDQLAKHPSGSSRLL